MPTKILKNIDASGYYQKGNEMNILYALYVYTFQHDFVEYLYKFDIWVSGINLSNSRKTWKIVQNFSKKTFYLICKDLID